MEPPLAEATQFKPQEYGVQGGSHEGNGFFAENASDPVDRESYYHFLSALANQRKILVECSPI